MTKKEQLLGDLFREALYTGNTTAEFLELFSKKISENFVSDDFLILQLGSQLYESAQIRKADEVYMDMQTEVTSENYNHLSETFPELSFYSEQRVKSAKSEIYKRCERVFDEGRSPAIRDLLASKIVLLEPENQETLGYEYKIVSETMKHFSYLNTQKDFPVSVNLVEPDKLVTKSNFSQEEHPNILLPNEKSIISGLSILGKDYISQPKTHGYQAFHSSYELISKLNSMNRIFSEIQVTTISQLNYEPANHNKYKQKRNEKWDKIFEFDENKVHIKYFYPEYNYDDSGFITPMYVTKKVKKVVHWQTHLSYFSGGFIFILFYLQQVHLQLLVFQFQY